MKQAGQLRQLWDLICPQRLGAQDLPPGIAEPPPPDRYPRDCAFDKGLAHRIAKEGISPRAIAPLGELIGLGAKHIAEVLDIDRGTPARQAARTSLGADEVRSILVAIRYGGAV